MEILKKEKEKKMKRILKRDRKIKLYTFKIDHKRRFAKIKGKNIDRTYPLMRFRRRK